MGIRKGIVSAVKTAAKGGSVTDVVKAGVVGAAPRGTRTVVSKVADKVVTPENIDRVKSGVKDVVDRGRSAAFSDSTPPPPPRPGGTGAPLPPAPKRI
jgi:hypothetical protein